MDARLMLLAKEPPSITGPMEVFSFDLFGYHVMVTESIIAEWCVLVVIGLLFFILGRNLKVKPTGKRQAAAEWIVSFFSDMVRDGMGPEFKKYTTYIGCLLVFSILSSLSGLFGLRSPTADLSVVGAWGLITFVLVERYKFKTGKIKGFLKSFVDPIPVMLPFNILGEFANPVSQTFRHYGNILGGMIIGTLVYWALGAFAIFIPAMLSLYFDIFSAVVQAYIFVSLTMAYVSMADCSG